MNRIFTLLVFLLSISMVQAQVQSRQLDGIHMSEQRSMPRNYSPSNQHARVALEDVYNPAFFDTCASTVVLFDLANFEPPGWGFVSGTNSFADQEKAQALEFTTTEDYTVVGVFAFFAEPSVVMDGEVVAKVYDMDDLGAPSTMLGESMPVSVSEIAFSDTTILETLFLFDEEMEIRPSGESFFASIDFSGLYDSQDTVAIWQTAIDCGDGSDSWDKFSDGSWNPVNDMTVGWAINFDFLIGAVVEFDEATSADAFIADGGLKLHPAFPNPARERVQLNYDLDQASEVEIKVVSLSGQVIYSRDLGTVAAGKQQQIIETSSLTPGTYVYRISTSHGNLSSVFVKE